MNDLQQKHDSWMNRYRDRSNPNYEEYTQIIKSNNSVAENINKGHAFISNCLYNEAIKVLNVAIDTGGQLLFDDNLLDENELAKAYLNRGVAYENLNNYEKALSDKTKSVEMLERICHIRDFPDENLLALSYMNRGQTYISVEEYNDALKDAEKSIEIWERLKRDGERIDEHRLSCAYANKNIASIKVEPLFDEKNMSNNDESELAAQHTMRGLNHLKINLFDESISDFDKSIEIIERLRTLPEVIAARAYGGRGMAYYVIGEYEKALPDVTKSIYFFEELQKHGQMIDEDILLNMYIIRGAIRNYKFAIDDEIDNDLGDAVSDYQNSIIIMEKFKKAGKPIDEDRLAVAYMGVAQSYDQKEDFFEANNYYDKCIEIWEQLVNEGQPLLGESDFATAYMNRGSNYYVMHKNDKALSDLNRCISIRERLKSQNVQQEVHDVSTSYRDRALAHETANNIEAAIKDYISAVRVLKDEFSERPDLQEYYYDILKELLDLVGNENNDSLRDKILQEFLHSMRREPKTKEAEEIQISILKQLK